MSEGRRTVTIKNRETGDVATTFDLTGLTDSELDRFWTALACKVDFEKWVAVDSATDTGPR